MFGLKSQRETRDAVFGGPGQAGLSHQMVELAKSVFTVNESVKLLAGQVGGEDGLATSFKMFRAEMDEKHRENKAEVAAVKQALIDTEAEREKKRQARQPYYIALFAAGVTAFIGELVILFRSLLVWHTGHL